MPELSVEVHVADMKTLGVLLVCLLNSAFLSRAAAAQEEPPFGIRSIIPSVSIGGFNEEPFFDKLADFPGGSEPIIIGVDSINVTFFSQKGSWHELTGQVMSIQVTYRLSNGSLYAAPRHGRSNTNCYDFYGCRNLTIELAPNEFIESIDGRTDGTKVNQMSIHTRKVKSHEKRIYGPLGSTGVKYFSFEGRVVSFFGNSGYNLNGIGAFLLPSAKQGPYFGTKLSGTDFDDDPDTTFAVSVAKIAKIDIYSNDTVYAIQAKYFLMNGTTVSGNVHGSDSKGTKSTVVFDDSEVLVGIEGILSDDGGRVDQLSFATRKKDGSSGKYGPYGSSSGGEAFTSYGYHVLGFSGNTGKSLNAISAYYEPYPGREKISGQN